MLIRFLLHVPCWQCSNVTRDNAAARSGPYGPIYCSGLGEPLSPRSSRTRLEAGQARLVPDHCCPRHDLRLGPRRGPRAVRRLPRPGPSAGPAVAVFGVAPPPPPPIPLPPTYPRHTTATASPASSAHASVRAHSASPAPRPMTSLARRILAAGTLWRRQPFVHVSTLRPSSCPWADTDRSHRNPIP